MAGFRVPAILLIVLASWTTHTSRAIDINLYDAVDLIRLGREVVTEVMESWEMIKSRDPGNEELDFPFVKRMEKELRQRIDGVSKKIDLYQERMEAKADTILTQLLQRLPMQRRLDDGLRELDHYVGQIHGLYKMFELYAANSDRFERYTITQFAHSCVSPRLGGLPDVLKSVHRLMVPSEQQVYNRSVLVLLANEMQVGRAWARDGPRISACLSPRILHSRLTISLSR